MHTRTFRAYMGTDVVGCEIAGATKNVMAIAAGISDGLALGDNTRAVLITRGLAELGRLGVTLGGKVLTFGGLAGVGDLVATCASPKSRNRTVGFALGQGRSLDEVVGAMRMVAEGVKSAGPLVGLARANGVEMPIAEQVAADRRRASLPARGAHGAHGPPVPPRVGRDAAARAAGVTELSEVPGGDDPQEAALARVREILHLHGVGDDEIDRAVADGVIDLFVAERMLIPSPASLHPRPGGRHHRRRPRPSSSASGAPSGSPTSTPTTPRSPISTSRRSGSSAPFRRWVRPTPRRRCTWRG